MTIAFVAGSIDALAGGGGLLTMPALMTAGLPPVVAIGTNKLQSTIGTGSAVLTFVRAGRTDLKAFALPAIGAFIGSLIGATAVQHTGTGFLNAFIPLLLIAMGLYFLLAPKISEADRHAYIGRAGMTAACGGIGLYDGFFGPGTGSFLTTALVTLGGLGLVRAIANAKLLNFATNVAGLTAMIVGGKVIWTLGLGMAAANIAGNQLGAWLAIRHEGRGARLLLIVVSLGLTTKFLVERENPIWRVLQTLHL